MEIFVDFGLFEIFGVLGLAMVSRALYARRSMGLLVLILSVLAPLILIFVVPEGPVRWLAVLTLGLGLMNAVVVLGALLSVGGVPALLERFRQSNRERGLKKVRGQTP